jgi:hypothetical protein
VQLGSPNLNKENQTKLRDKSNKLLINTNRLLTPKSSVSNCFVLTKLWSTSYNYNDQIKGACYA